MTAYPYYEEYSAKTKLNTETRFIIILIVAVVMGGIVAYIIGFQQGSVTTNAVNNTQETEQPIYIERNSEPAPATTYNDYSYNTNDCSDWLADAYRVGCPERTPIKSTPCPEPAPAKSTGCLDP